MTFAAPAPGAVDAVGRVDGGSVPGGVGSGWVVRRRVGVWRWLAPWKDSRVTPVLYHVISRVVDRRLAFGRDEKEHFRTLMRRMERFSGCRVLAYAVMGNHFHLLLEVPPRPEAGLDVASLDRALFAQRLAGIYSPGVVAGVLKSLDEAVGATDGSEAARRRATAQIAGPYLVRMHDLSEFINGLLKRFTRWFNRRHQRTGTLWEERFKSVIVESGIPARAVAAYIDLNPVRAGLAKDPADYRWSSYGEAAGAAGATVAGKWARGGLVRALMGMDGVGDDAGRWSEVSGRYRLLLRQAMERKGRGVAVRRGDEVGAVAGPAVADPGGGPPGQGGGGRTGVRASFEPEMGFAGMLMGRVRRFTGGAVIGSRECVEQCFEAARERFGPKRTRGARRLRGAAGDAAGIIWAARDVG